MSIHPSSCLVQYLIHVYLSSLSSWTRSGEGFVWWVTKSPMICLLSIKAFQIKWIWLKIFVSSSLCGLMVEGIWDHLIMIGVNICRGQRGSDGVLLTQSKEYFVGERTCLLWVTSLRNKYMVSSKDCCILLQELQWNKINWDQVKKYWLFARSKTRKKGSTK